MSNQKQIEPAPIEINGIRFDPIPGVRYKHAYWDVPRQVKMGKGTELEWYGKLLLDDLFFFVYFVLGIPTANHPFIVDACKDVDAAPDNLVLFLWAREHFKTSIITTAKGIRKVLRNKEERIGIFSHSRAVATAIMRPIKELFETSELLKACFPDVLYQDPKRESPKWAEEAGITVKRKSTARECTFEPHGLLEGMPTGRHFTGRIYDDVETADLVYTPDVMTKLKEMFLLSQALGMEGGWHWVIGTPYHHEGLLMYLKNLKQGDAPLYTLSEKPVTTDGTPNGPLVFFTPEYWKTLQVQLTRIQLFSQYLINPTPRGEQKLNYGFIQHIDPRFIPKRLYKFMVIDPAGSDKTRQGDSWAIMVVGVEPYRDDLGASNIYILDLQAEPMSEAEALDRIVAMYLRNGRILKLGVEKVGLSSTEVHVANALRARGRVVSLEKGTLEILRPAGRSKEDRIDQNLQWPLNNGKIFLSEGISSAYRQRLQFEMDKYPFWHDDVLDALSYVYDLVKNYRFGTRPPEEEEKKPVRDRWARAFERQEEKRSWMVV